MKLKLKKTLPGHEGFQIHEFHLIYLLLISLVSAACGSESNIPGLDDLKELCKKDAGLTIYKTVEVAGYYDATRKGEALWSLVSSDYSYIEFCNHDVEKSSFGESGCWRLKKVSRESGQCNETVDKALKGNGSDASVNFRLKKCIAVKKIEKPTAQYKYEVETKKWWINEHDETRVTSSVGRIVNIKTGEILGKAKNYVLRPKRSTPPSFHCGSAQLTGLQKSRPFAVGLIDNTLIPVTNNKQGESK